LGWRAGFGFLPPSFIFRSSFSPLSALVPCLLLSGCAATLPGDQPLTASYRPANVFVGSPTLPPNVKRVAVLPLASDEHNSDLVAGREALEPVLLSELMKSRKFEVSRLPAGCLRLGTGRSAWSSEDPLPPTFFSTLHDTAGCDAVLFCRLTVFRAYAPLAVGWRLRLVDARTGATLWAADEMFDAGQPAVLAGARRFQLAELRSTSGSPEQWLILNSPRQFGQYAAASLVASIPGP
jgi:hypothetical protein